MTQVIIKNHQVTLFVQVLPLPDKTRWLVVETYDTTEGRRSRVCGSRDTEASGIAYYNKLKDRIEGTEP